MARTVTAIFDEASAAARAVDRLTALGISRDAISVLMSEETRGRYFGIETKSKAPEGAALGAAAGGVLGALAGGLVAVGSLAVTGVGLVAVGPLVAALAGLGAGGAAGGIIGALIGLGMPEHEAELVAEELDRGGILVGVETADADQADDVEEIFADMHAHSLATY
ncbi:MAG: hypothetical protein NTZ09_14285 [Candidatus Hydrogenedentes bacterium]|nr:hypothetical protein [Candidatus Hydrogenedentota bacterium]